MSEKRRDPHPRRSATPPLPNRERGPGGEGFKTTELGDLPAEWDVVRLVDVVAVKGGKRLPKGQSFADQITSHPYIRVVDFENNSINLSDLKYITDELHLHIKRYVISSEDVYISIAGTIGRVGTVPAALDGANLTENAAKLVIEDKSQLLNRFLVYYLTSASGQYQIQIRAAKTSQPKLALTRIKQIPIPLPPLDEQRKIAHVLNTVQQAIAAQDDLIAAAQELKRSLMRRLFTYGPGSEPAPTKETDIGEVPEHWEVVELQEVVDIIYGIQAAVAHMTDPSVGIPILTNINMTLEGKLDFSTLRYYEVSKKQQEKILRKGDVLFNWRSGSPHHVGKTAIFNMDGDYTFSSFILRFRVTEDVNNIYLAYYLHWLKERSFFMQKRQQSSVNSVFNKSAASLIPTIVPPLDEQHQIAHILQAADAKIAAEQDRKVALQELFNSLLQELMTGRRRV